MSMSLDMAVSNYYDTECHTCRTDICVRITDRAPRAYCSACAMAKFAEPIHEGSYQQQELI